MWSHPLTSIDLYMQLSLLLMATRTMWFSVAIFRPSEGERELDRPVTCSEDVEELDDCMCVVGEWGGDGMSVGECMLAAPNDVSNVHQSIVRNYNLIWQVAQSSCGFILFVTIGYKII